MKFLRDLFSDSSTVSMMRVMSFLSLMIAAYLAIKGHNESVGTFVYAAFGGKAVQKYIETTNLPTPKA